MGWVYLPGSADSNSGLNGRGWSGPSALLRRIHTVRKFSRSDFQTSRSGMTSPRSTGDPGAELLTLFPGAIHAPLEVELKQAQKQNIPTCPVFSSQLSDNAGPDGWSAKMFLHQMMCVSRKVWNVSDTERLLLGSMPLRLHAKVERETLLSAVIKQPNEASEKCYRSLKMARGVVRRALKRNRSVRVLLRTRKDTIPVIISFGMDNFESWTAMSELPLPVFLLIGLMDYLRRASLQ